MSGAWDRLKYFLNYAYVDATYETDETLASVTGPTGCGSRRAIGSPASRRTTSSWVRRSPSSRTSGLVPNVITTSGSFLRGDDGNTQAQVDGYTLLNLNARYVPVKYSSCGRASTTSRIRSTQPGARSISMPLPPPSRSSASSLRGRPWPAGWASGHASDRWPCVPSALCAHTARACRALSLSEHDGRSSTLVSPLAPHAGPQPCASPPSAVLPLSINCGKPGDILSVFHWHAPSRSRNLLSPCYREIGASLLLL